MIFLLRAPFECVSKWISYCQSELTNDIFLVSMVK